jgi:hypothetical protein
MWITNPFGAVGLRKRDEAERVGVGRHRVMREWERLRIIDEVCGTKCVEIKCVRLSVSSDSLLHLPVLHLVLYA